MITTYRRGADGLPLIKKDPLAVLDYIIDWAADPPIGPWLATGEVITSIVITAESGITVQSSSYTSTQVTVWLAGGTMGTPYLVKCQITTNQGRTDERSFWVHVVQR